MDNLKPVVTESPDKTESIIHTVPSDEKRPKKKIKRAKRPVKEADRVQLEDSLKGINLEDSTKKLYVVLISFLRELKKYIGTNYHPKVIFDNLNRLFGNRLTHRDVIIGGLGLLLGGLIGYWLAVATSEKSQGYICMQAVQCFRFTGVEGVTVADDAIVPKNCGIGEVLVSVKAGCVDTIDFNICNGYGFRLRNTLKKHFKYWRGQLPITLGRSCSGVVVEIGENVTRLEIGDEVWLTTPFWAPGALSQYVLSPEYNITRKPERIGFESSSSLPYAGGLALSTLNKAKITPENAPDKRVLIHGGCTAVGCVLVQLLKLWKAELTITCYEKSSPVAKALGVEDIIGLEFANKGAMYPNLEDQTKFLKKELDIRQAFDAIITTCKCEISDVDLHNYCQEDGIVISTLPQHLLSDSFGFFMGTIFSLYIRSKCFLQRLFWGRISGFGEPHISHLELDKLAEYVEKGDLQTVVDKVFQPYDIEQALLHIQSTDSIGGCIISFR